MNLIEKQIFITSIYEGNVENVDHSLSANEAYGIRMKDNGRKMESYAGWHSNQLLVEDVEKTQELKKIVKTVYNSAVSVANSWKYNNELSFVSCWLNINKPGDFNEQHRHPGTNLSAVYYVKANPNSGNIWFIRDGRTEDYFPNIGKNTSHTTPRVSELPQNGRFYIFPSHIDHKVDPNLSDDDRISMAFNFNFR